MVEIIALSPRERLCSVDCLNVWLYCGFLLGFG